MEIKKLINIFYLCSFFNSSHRHSVHTRLKFWTAHLTSPAGLGVKCKGRKKENKKYCEFLLLLISNNLYLEIFVRKKNLIKVKLHLTRRSLTDAKVRPVEIFARTVLLMFAKLKLFLSNILNTDLLQYAPVTFW